jgi:general secretion pathway protein J
MHSNCRRETGFTLIELLFAIFIFAIVISAVYGAYRATFQVTLSSEEHMRESNKARAALERITEDLTAIVTGPGGSLLGSEQDISGGRADTMTFISSSHVALSKKETIAGDARISYSVVADETDNTITLMRSDTIILPGAAGDNDTTFLLCDGLKEVRFSYTSPDGETTTEWEGESVEGDDGKLIAPELPKLITIELVFANEQKDGNGSVFKTAVALSEADKE